MLLFHHILPENQSNPVCLVVSALTVNGALLQHAKSLLEHHLQIDRAQHLPVGSSCSHAETDSNATPLPSALVALLGFVAEVQDVPRAAVFTRRVPRRQQTLVAATSLEIPAAPT